MLDSGQNSVVGGGGGGMGNVQKSVVIKGPFLIDMFLVVAGVF